MIRTSLGLAALGALLALAGCSDTDGAAPYDYSTQYNHSIDADIAATHGAGAPLISNQGPRGSENWRLGDPRPVAR